MTTTPFDFDKKKAMPPKAEAVDTGEKVDSKEDEAQKALIEKLSLEKNMLLKELELKKEHNEKLKAQNVEMKTRIHVLEEQLQNFSKARVDLTSGLSLIPIFPPMFSYGTSVLTPWVE